jgi:dGTP triphosphohydrolase
LLWFYVIEDPSLVSVQFGYTKLVEGLFDILLEATDGNSHTLQLFPEYIREHLENNKAEAHRCRIVSDYIAGMTEFQVVDYYKRLSAISFGDSLDRIVF